MPSANHLSTVTTFSDWGHTDRLEIDEAEASAAWATIHKAHLDDPQQKHSVASMTISRGWYGPHVSRYPPPPPPLPIPVSPKTTSICNYFSQEALSQRTSYVTPYIKPSSSFNGSDHYARRESINDESKEEFPPRNDPLTPRKMGGDVPYPYISVGSFSAGGFQMHRDSLLDSSCPTGESAHYPLSASTLSNSGSGDQSLKMSRRSGLVLSAVSAPAIEYKDEKGPAYKYQVNSCHLNMPSICLGI